VAPVDRHGAVAALELLVIVVAYQLSLVTDSLPGATDLSACTHVLSYSLSLAVRTYWLHVRRFSSAFNSTHCIGLNVPFLSPNNPSVSMYASLFGSISEPNSQINCE
jgi:hypothetical protein